MCESQHRIIILFGIINRHTYNGKSDRETHQRCNNTKYIIASIKILKLPPSITVLPHAPAKHELKIAWITSLINRHELEEVATPKIF